DPAFVLWIAKHGGQLHDQFARLVNQRLNELAEFERDGNISELDRIRAAAPCAVPRPMMRTVWRLLLLGRIKSNLPDVDLYPWRGCFKRDGMTPSLRQAFKEFLTPCILLRKPFGRWVGDVGNDDDAQNSREGIIGWELELRADNVHYDLRDLKGSTVWQDALPDLLPDLGLLLRDAFDLMNELGRVNQYCDYSYIHQPSISEHPQNKKFHDWTVLIDLSRDAWLALAAQSPGQANLIALQWLHTPYPLFKRLAYFAATQGTVIPTQVALEWLLFDEGWWLWSVETTCEILRLLVALSSRLEPDDLRRLESAILIGPPRDMFRNDQLLNDLEQIVEREIWLRLAKMDASGAVLGSNAKAELSRLSAKYPQWQLAADERELFPFWMGDGDDLREFIVTPRSRRELVTWLKQYPNTDYARREDDWRQRCRNEFARTACALCSLTRENTWPKDRWREALQAWTEEKLLQRTWRYMAPVLTKAPDDVIQELASSLSQWLMELAKSFEGHQTLFFIFCKRILSMSYKDDVETDEPLMRAINHPVGQVSEALLRWWYRHEPKDNQGLPDEIKSIFSQLCDQHKPVYRHARVLFAAHAITFYRVDPEWTKHNLLPNFEWRASTIEANAAWSGFLGSPRLYRPLFEIIHPAFLETARHYRELGSKGRQYVALLTFAALESRRDPFNVEDLSAAIETLPPEGRLDALRTLVQALDGAGGQRDEYWANRILPYWISIWPKSRGHHSQALSGEVARLCIAAFEVFPKALETLRDWLQPLKDLSIIVYQLEQKGLTKLFPENALAFLDIIVGDESGWLPRDLGKCLKDIREADARLEQDQRFLRLVEKLRQDGGR
ncbi:MAG: hypothetical protein OEV64_11440, partial [Desulfobulbaceae bacterium]|nr:hypothetical protein [Desulfobulbaceae bacterium]